MAINIGDILTPEQAFGLQSAGYQIKRVGSGGGALGAGIQYQVTGLPPGQGPQAPFGSETSFDGTTTGSSSLTGETSRELPPEVRKRLQDLIDRLLGQKEFGYSPEEMDALLIGPAERSIMLQQSGQPIAGAANAARDELLRRNAARGGASAGVNSTLERIQQEQGRQAGQAANEARQGIMAANRAAMLAAANARINQESDVSRQAGGLLEGYPEFTGRTDQQTTSEQNTQSEQTTLPTTPSGRKVSGGVAVGGGGSGVGYVKPSGGAPTTLPKKKPAGGLIPMLP